MRNECFPDKVFQANARLAQEAKGKDEEIVEDPRLILWLVATFRRMEKIKLGLAGMENGEVKVQRVIW